MADKDIEFRLKTTADTSGADEVADALKDTSDAAREAGTAKSANLDQELQQLEDLKKRTEDLKKATGDLKDETGEFSREQIRGNKALDLGGAAMGGVAAGGAIVAKIFGEIGEAINSIDIDHLRGLNAVMATQVETAQAWAQVLTDPINGIQRLFSGDTIGGAFEGLNTQLELNAQNAERLRKERLDASLRDQAKIKQQYDDETAALIRQKQELERILAIRSQMAGLFSDGLAQETRSAELRGGDVELAKSNELAAKLQQGLQGLGAELRQAETEREIAQRQVALARENYQKGLEDNLNSLDPALMTALEGKIREAEQNLRAADQSLIDQKNLFTTAKTNLLRGIENDLAALETEGTQTVSQATQKVRDSVYESLKQEVTNLGQDTTKVITESFAKLRENQTKANDGVAQNTGELIAVANRLSEIVRIQGEQIATLTAQVQSMR